MSELLAPAGTLEKLKWAVQYGADAVYFGLKDFSLRSFAGNFTLDEAQEGIDFLHKQNKKGYVTLNIYPFTEEYDSLLETVQALQEIGVDACIISDLGVIHLLKQNNIKIPIHISTQANTISAQAALAYKELGAKRVNLARELSLTNIQDIQIFLQGRIETEVFIHGSVCYSYSGRCSISDYLTEKRANRGECTYPCRWKYNLYLEEELRPGQYMPIFEDDRGTYFFHAKELALFHYIPELLKAGITSFKLEGRMKSIHYLAYVVSLYKKVLSGENISLEKGLEWLNKVPNRGYSDGFIKGEVNHEDYNYHATVKQGHSRFVAASTEELKDNQRVVEVKNNIQSGETVEMLTPNGVLTKYTFPTPLTLKDGKQVDTINQQDILLPNDIPAYAIFSSNNFS
ncbi:MAG: U32 family peptidase C-terminal domain-containing protein [Planctomycetes bacterium]|jgi:putative protease|nr:U32 family peptidase C-terminal domain-containing protein [Planctomycetota bacterium]HNZ65813.1 U32 family peptidase C-terminal domain-containing protein [Planctomycetota bacterium]HPY75335.1 U32 family peptidase C-terminal domain-containing protein [Planctomycetota bacterium]HQA99708.1 U32 family peptidase C-terminal domain-containing protein [Planctomycetota bacterium]